MANSLRIDYGNILFTDDVIVDKYIHVRYLCGRAECTARAAICMLPHPYF